MLLLLPSLLGIYETVQSRHWPSALGRIDSITAEGPSEDFGRHYYVTVTYHYVLNGQTLIGSGVNLDSRGQVSSDSYKALLQRYPIGKAVQVYINPDNPYQTVLEFGFGLPTLVLLFLGAVFCVIGMSNMLFRIVLVLRKKHP